MTQATRKFSIQVGALTHWPWRQDGSRPIRPDPRRWVEATLHGPLEFGKPWRRPRAGEAYLALRVLPMATPQAQQSAPERLPLRVATPMMSLALKLDALLGCRFLTPLQASTGPDRHRRSTAALQRAAERAPPVVDRR